MFSVIVFSKHLPVREGARVLFDLSVHRLSLYHEINHIYLRPLVLVRIMAAAIVQEQNFVICM